MKALTAFSEFCWNKLRLRDFWDFWEVSFNSSSINGVRQFTRSIVHFNSPGAHLLFWGLHVLVGASHLAAINGSYGTNSQSFTNTFQCSSLLGNWLLCFDFNHRSCVCAAICSRPAHPCPSCSCPIELGGAYLHQSSALRAKDFDSEGTSVNIVPHRHERHHCSRDYHSFVSASFRGSSFTAFTWFCLTSHWLLSSCTSISRCVSIFLSCAETFDECLQAKDIVHLSYTNRRLAEILLADELLWKRLFVRGNVSKIDDDLVTYAQRYDLILHRFPCNRSYSWPQWIQHDCAKCPPSH